MFNFLAIFSASFPKNESSDKTALFFPIIFSFHLFQLTFTLLSLSLLFFFPFLFPSFSSNPFSNGIVFLLSSNNFHIVCNLLTEQQKNVILCLKLIPLYLPIFLSANFFPFTSLSSNFSPSNFLWNFHRKKCPIFGIKQKIAIVWNKKEGRKGSRIEEATGRIDGWSTWRGRIKSSQKDSGRIGSRGCSC